MGQGGGRRGFFAEMIVAPSFDPKALEIIRSREGWGGEVRLLETGSLTGARNKEKFIRYVVAGPSCRTATWWR